MHFYSMKIRGGWEAIKCCFNISDIIVELFTITTSFTFQSENGIHLGWLKYNFVRDNWLTKEDIFPDFCTSSVLQNLTSNEFFVGWGEEVKILQMFWEWTVVQTARAKAFQKILQCHCCSLMSSEKNKIFFKWSNTVLLYVYRNMLTINI